MSLSEEILLGTSFPVLLVLLMFLYNAKNYASVPQANQQAHCSMQLTSADLLALKRKIDFYNRAYHSNHQSLIDDSVFDQLVEAYNHAAKCLKQPLIYPDHRNSKNNIYRQHNVTFGTVKKAHSEQEIEKFLKKYQNNLQLQPKIDGIAIGLIYQKGQMTAATTRGNDQRGINIGSIARAVVDIPNMLPEKALVEVQGELFALTECKKYLSEYTSPRHFVSGVVSQTKPNPEHLNCLGFFPWKLTIDNDNTPDNAALLTQWKFKWVDRHTHQVHSMEEIRQLKKHYDPYQNQALPFLTDGIVLKAPHYLKSNSDKVEVKQLAWKLEPDKAVTAVTDIDFTIGRTGKQTVVLTVTPTELRGRNIKKVSLGSIDTWHKLDVAIGDMIAVKLSGESIPILDEVLFRKKQRIKPSPPNAEVYNGYSCLSYSKTCHEQFLARLTRFTGQDGLSIVGLNRRQLSRLVDNQTVNTLSDIFNLTENQLYDVEVSKVKAHQIINSIQQAHLTPFWQQLLSLSIPNVGLHEAKKIAQNYSNWQTLLTDLVNSDVAFSLSSKEKKLLLFITLPENLSVVQNHLNNKKI